MQANKRLVRIRSGEHPDARLIVRSFVNRVGRRLADQRYAFLKVKRLRPAERSGRHGDRIAVLCQRVMDGLYVC